MDLIFDCFWWILFCGFMDSIFDFVDFVDLLCGFMDSIFDFVLWILWI